MSIVAECPAGVEAGWKAWLGADTMTNGQIKINGGGVEQTTWSAGGGAKTWTKAMAEGGEKLDFDFYPDADVASAWCPRAQLTITDADIGFEECLNFKNCLEVLGDGGDDSYTLRSSNKVQLQCLTGTGLPSDLSDKCTEWLDCIRTHTDTDASLVEARKRQKSSSASQPETNTQIQFLTAYLQAAGTTTDSLLLLRSPHNRSKAKDTAGCFNPSVDDPEALGCDCQQNLMDKCNYDDDCYKGCLCDNSGICQSWKDANCPSGTACPASLSALMDNRRTAVSDESQERGKKWARTRDGFGVLDSTTGGKTC
jgi:hypothetical protein